MTKLNVNNLPLALQELLPVALQPQCVCLSGTKDERLFVQSKKPEQMFYVISGEVVLLRSGAQGEHIVLQRVRRGFVAEASLQSANYHCDAIVTVAGDFIVVPIAPIRQALLTDSAFAIRWIGMLNQEVKRLRGQCERLSLKGVRDRLLHLIESEGQSGSLSLGTGLKSIALELGVTHEALYRTVAELEKQKILVRENGQIRVV
jgi:CRP-like cAMP-binding protein